METEVPREGPQELLGFDRQYTVLSISQELFQASFLTQFQIQTKSTVRSHVVDESELDSELDQ